MKKNNPKQTAEAKLKRLINETVKKQLREWSDQEEIDAYDADLKDDMRSVSDITGDEVSDNDIDRLNTRNFGIEAGANPTFKRLKDVQMKNDWESYENDDDTEYDETDKDPHAYFDYNFNTFDEPYHRNKFIRNENVNRNNKRTIKLSEAKLHNIIMEAVNKVLNEGKRHKRR